MTTATKPIPSLQGITYPQLQASIGNYGRTLTRPVEFSDDECRILERVAELAEKTHWIKGTYETIARYLPRRKDRPPDKVCGCFVGLMNMANRELQTGIQLEGRTKVDLHRKVLAVIGALYKRKGWTSIEDWNDDEGTLRSHVVRVAREAQKLRAHA